jgi:hypothetical protein
LPNAAPPFLAAGAGFPFFPPPTFAASSALRLLLRDVEDWTVPSDVKKLHNRQYHTEDETKTNVTGENRETKDQKH